MKITKSTLKRIIKEEILRESKESRYFWFKEKPPLVDSGFYNVGIDDDRLAQFRELFSSFSPSEYKKLDNILKAYEIVNSMEDPDKKSRASDYFIYYLGKGAFELANRYSNHDPKSGERLNLSRLDLSGLDLSGAYLRGANLNGAKLRNANLTGADLINSSLFKTDLTGADLTNSFMTNVRLDKTNFTNANLANVRLLPFLGVEGSGLEGSIFKGAKWNSKTMINNFWFGSDYVRPQAARFRDENELVRTDEVGPMGAPDDAVLLSDL